MGKKFGILFLIYLIQIASAINYPADTKTACDHLAQIILDAKALPTTLTCRQKIINDATINTDNCPMLLNDPSLLNSAAYQQTADEIMASAVRIQTDLDACKGITPPATTKAVTQSTVTESTASAKQVTTAGTQATTEATTEATTATETTASTTSAPAPSGLMPNLTKSLEDLISLYSVTNSSTTAPNCCIAPIQKDIALLMQLILTYKANYVSNSESITYNFVQGLNSNIEILKANWTACQTSGLCCNATLTTTTTSSTTTSTTSTPTTTSTITTTTPTTTSTSTTTTPTTTSTSTTTPTTTSTTSTTTTPTTTSTSTTTPTTTSTSTTTPTTTSTTTTTPTTTSTITTTSTTAVTTSTTPGPNTKICAFTQDVDGDKKACFISTTYSYSMASATCSKNGMFLYAINTNDDLSKFNTALGSLLNLDLTRIVTASEYWVNAGYGGTTDKFYYSFAPDKTKITASYTGLLGSCMIVKKNLLLSYDLITSSCSQPKYTMCQYT